MIRFINNLICALGCITVALALAVLIWLPTRPAAQLQILLAADRPPISVNVTGYEALMLANGLSAIPAKLALLIGELQSQEGGEQLLSQYEVGERQQDYIRDLADQTQSLSGVVVPFQIAFFVLPVLALFMAIIVSLSRGYFGEQLIKGIVLIALTLAAAAVTAGATLYISERLDAVIKASLAQNAAGFPGLGIPVNDKLPELRVGVVNLIDVRTPVIASSVALIGAIVGMLGAALSARKPGLNPRQIAQAAMLQAQIATNGMPITPSPHLMPPAGPLQPTQRLNSEPAPSPVAAAPEPAPAPTVASSRVTAPPQTPSPQVLPSSSAASSSPPASPSPSARRVCSTCGAPAQGTEKFCRSCGARLPPA